MSRLINTDIKCDDTVAANLFDNVTIRCELGNVDATAVETVAVYHDDILLFNETWSNGKASSSDDAITLRYTHEEIAIDIFKIQCSHDGMYIVLVNNLLGENSTLVIESKIS